MSNKNAYLKEMGIDVWLERNPSISDNVNTEAAGTTDSSVEIQTTEPLVKAIDESSPSSIAAIETLGWQALQLQVAECKLCTLHETRRQTVFDSGSRTARLMIIGDYPNAEDDQQGEVFSGPAGMLLNAMLKAMGYQRNDVYVSNIIKCKTTENQEPSETQANSCEPYLLRQIKLVEPKLILVLGNAAAQRLLKSKSSMSRLRGQLHYVDGISAPILVSYHPTYLLACPNEKRKAWQDLQIVMKELEK